MRNLLKLVTIFFSLFFAFTLTHRVALAGIYDVKGGVRVPAGSCVTYIDTLKTQVTSVNGALILSNTSGPVQAHCVCQLPVPEKAKIRQFVMVGNVTKGEIFAYIAAEAWNQPHQVPFFADISLLPTTPYEVPDEKQKKVARSLPVSGSESLTIDRANTYFIEAMFKTDSAISTKEALELFYFEVYWD
jgi:hypothetical protein